MKYIFKGIEKGTIVCIHGNSSSAKAFRKLLKSDKILNTKILIELKGHGDNQNKDYELDDFSFESQKKYILHKLSEINDDILLIGNSLGGHLAIEITNEVKNLKGLVIMGTPPVKKPINFEEAFIPVEALNTYLTENPSKKEITEAVHVAVNKKSKSKMLISDFNRANPLVRKALAIDLTQDKLLDQFSIFTKLSIPKYIIAGDSDPSVNRKYLEHVKNSCQDSSCNGGDNSCKIIDLENCGHFPSIEKPKQFVKIISDIVKDVF